MICSILDNDLYKFSTSYAYMKLYPDAEGTFVFTDRNHEEYSINTVKEISNKINMLDRLALVDSEYKWCINTIKYIPECYWEWLKQFRFDSSKINVSQSADGQLTISITDKLYRATLYEVPILAIVSEARNDGNNPDIFKILTRLDAKISISNEFNLPFSEFGTRRRFSSYIHQLVLGEIQKKSKYCVGTSNLYFAKMYNMKPIGTFPHEWVMFHGALYGYREANYLSLQDWIKVYDGNLGIFLIDTYTSKVGLRNMSLKYAKLLDGVRQDSGDEFEIGDMVINRYKELGIDPTTKTIVFSNALTFDKYLKIYQYFKDRIKISAGIGTNLTNDTEYTPANIVMKLSECRINGNQEWRKCIKISDDNDKHLGDSREFEIVKYQLEL